MSTTRVRVDPDDPRTFPKGKMDLAVVDGATEEQIALHQREDDEEAMKDMARYAPGAPSTRTNPGRAKKPQDTHLAFNRFQFGMNSAPRFSRLRTTERNMIHTRHGR